MSVYIYIYGKSTDFQPKKKQKKFCAKHVREDVIFYLYYGI